MAGRQGAIKAQEERLKARAAAKAAETPATPEATTPETSVEETEQAAEVKTPDTTAPKTEEKIAESPAKAPTPATETETPATEIAFDQDKFLDALDLTISEKLSLSLPGGKDITDVLANRTQDQFYDGLAKSVNSEQAQSTIADIRNNEELSKNIYDKAVSGEINLAELKDLSPSAIAQKVLGDDANTPQSIDDIINLAKTDPEAFDTFWDANNELVRSEIAKLDTETLLSKVETTLPETKGIIDALRNHSEVGEAVKNLLENDQTALPGFLKLATAEEAEGGLTLKNLEDALNTEGEIGNEFRTGLTKVLNEVAQSNNDDITFQAALDFGNNFRDKYALDPAAFLDMMVNDPRELLNQFGLADHPIGALFQQFLEQLAPLLGNAANSVMAFGENAMMAGQIAQNEIRASQAEQPADVEVAADAEAPEITTAFSDAANDKVHGLGKNFNSLELEQLDRALVGDITAHLNRHWNIALNDDGVVSQEELRKMKEHITDDLNNIDPESLSAKFTDAGMDNMTPFQAEIIRDKIANTVERLETSENAANSGPALGTGTGFT